jgi:hypothetical protein
MRTFWLIGVGMVLAALAACQEGTGPVDSGARSLVVTPAVDTLRALQDTVRLKAEVRDGRGETLAGATVVWTSLNPQVVSVDSLGQVVSLDVGTARVTATAGQAADTVAITVISGVSPNLLKVVRFATAVPPLATRDTSFMAVRGRGVEIKLRYRGERSGEEGDEFLVFKIPGNSLLTYPDGRGFAERDSVRIRLRIDDPTRFLFTFEPSGLRFDPRRPAELQVDYDRAEMEDVKLEGQFSLWRQEQADAPWVRLSTARVRELREVKANITGFTGFALATNARGSAPEQ